MIKTDARSTSDMSHARLKESREEEENELENTTNKVFKKVKENSKNI